MSQRLIVLDEAEEELIEAEKWYERQLPGLGWEFRSAIERVWSTFSRRHTVPLQSSTFPRSLVPDEFLLNGSHIRLCSLNTAKISGLLRLPIITDDQVTGETDWYRSAHPIVSGATQLTIGLRRTR